MTRGRLPRVGLNVFADERYGAAAGPLFARGLVDALEWDVDDSWGSAGAVDRVLPRWLTELLDLYADGGALYGHGVWFSPLTARWLPRQARWLDELRRECARRRYRHLSEHFGFMLARNFSRSTLLPVPYTAAAVRVGRDRLRRLADASGLPVGLESTAVALTAADAVEQGAFLDEILAPGDGFLVLDVHNLWMQAHNLGLAAETLLDGYPLGRVRELHVSGGSWYQPASEPERGPVRLDSHDGPLPDEALALLPLALRRCPHVELVIMEHRGANLASDEAAARYQADFVRLRALVEAERG